MAKMKVHELAKELDRKSKELIDFLQAKGYEVKVAQSSIEDDAIALVRKEFSSSGDKAAKAVGEEKQSRAEEKPRSEEPSVKEKTAPAAGGEKAAPAKSAPERPAAESEKRDGKGEAPKKKRIIFVSNPHNSKMGGRQAQGGGNGQGGQNSQNRGGNRPMSNGARPVQPQNTPHKIIRPTQKPIPVTAEPYDVRQKQQQERRLEQRQQEKRQQEKRQQEKWQQEKRDNNKNTAAGNKPAPGQGRVESAGENRRPEGQSRPNYSGGQGDRSRGGAPNAYGRNAGGGDRPQRGNGGRTIDLRKITVRRTLSLKHLPRMRKSTGTTKSAG